MSDSRRIVFLGLSITSSWGNGHATNYRALMAELSRRGHHVTFLERDMPWYAAHRDLVEPPYGRTFLYGSRSELESRFAQDVREADLVVVGSYVPEGIALGEWVTRTTRGIPAFYDLDTPVTLDRLDRGDCDYLSAELIPRYRLYLSFTGGPTLRRLEREYGSPMACAFYCLVDPDTYADGGAPPASWDLGYLGTWSADRQEALERLMLSAAATRLELRFVVAGPQYPATVGWPANVQRIEHLAPDGHAGFYATQRFTLNVTRAAMIDAGWSPSVRLFEAAAAGVPVISDRWPGLDRFFVPGEEILISHGAADTLGYLDGIEEQARVAIGARARARVLAEHTAAHRADQLEDHVDQLLSRMVRR